MESFQKIFSLISNLTLTPHRRLRLIELIEGVKNQHHLVESTAREGMAGLLYTHLLASGAIELLDPGLRDRLQKIYRKTAQNNLVRIRALSELIRQLNRESIPVVVLKGMALLPEIYRDIGLREMTDIDLWVLPLHIENCKKILLGCGFRQDRTYASTFLKGAISIDLHSHFIGADRIRSRASIMGDGAASIFDRAVGLTIAEEPALGLAAHDQVLYLWLHAVKHRISRWIWLADIQCLVWSWSKTDWDQFSRYVRRVSQSRSLAALLFLMERTGLRPTNSSGVNPPPLNGILKWALKQRTKKSALPYWAPYLLFAPDRGFRPWLTHAFETLFPRPEILRQVFYDFPDAPPWQLYTLRAIQIGARILDRSLKPGTQGAVPPR